MGDWYRYIFRPGAEIGKSAQVHGLLALRQYSGVDTLEGRYRRRVPKDAVGTTIVVRCSFRDRVRIWLEGISAVAVGMRVAVSVASLGR